MKQMDGRGGTCLIRYDMLRVLMLPLRPQLHFIPAPRRFIKRVPHPVSLFRVGELHALDFIRQDDNDAEVGAGDGIVQVVDLLRESVRRIGFVSGLLGCAGRWVSEGSFSNQSCA